VVIAATGVALAASYGAAWLLLLLYVATASAAIFGDRSKPVLAAVLVCAAIGTTVTIGVLKHVDPATYLGDAVGMVLASALVVVVRQMSRLIWELRATRQQLAESAVAEERLRFSRDLHDLLGHTLSVMVVKAEVVRRLVLDEPARAAAAAADIEQLGRTALAEVRETVTGYRERPFATELDGARAALTDAGIEVTVSEVGTPLPASADALFGWALREGATNVLRHSRARRCTIAVRRDGDGASLEIRDDGVGDSRNGGGHGLRGLRERLTAAGGGLCVSAPPGGGFSLVATLPEGE
jgi:two-component system sensor histidine kinase DesK